MNRDTIEAIVRAVARDALLRAHAYRTHTSEEIDAIIEASAASVLSIVGMP